MPRKTIELVLEEYTSRLMALPGVVGVALGKCKGKPCIKVYVIHKTDKLVRQMPSGLEGYPVSIEESGEFRALDRQ